MTAPALASTRAQRDEEDAIGLDGVGTWFNAVEEDDESDGELIAVEVGDDTFHCSVIPDDGATNTGRVLFASHVWNGARSIASHLHNFPALARGRRTLEVGAGAALPSLVSLTARRHGRR